MQVEERVLKEKNKTKQDRAMEGGHGCITGVGKAWRSPWTL